MRPSELSIPSSFNSARLSSQEALEGLSSQSIPSAEKTPRSLHSRTRVTRSARKISGGKSLMRESCWFHKRMQVPSHKRPARPFLCSAENSLSVWVVSFSIPVFKSMLFTRASPESITIVTPETVSEVSAIAEERITRRFCFSSLLGGVIMRFCSCSVMLE